MAKKIGEQSWQTANRIAQQDLNIPLDSKGGFSNTENLLKLKNMNELKTEQTIEKIIDMISDFGDGLLEFETTDINCLLNQLTLQENYNDMLVREIEGLKKQKWIPIKDQKPADYDKVLYFDSRDGNMHVGYFVWSQTPVDYVTHWMKLPAPPSV